MPGASYLQPSFLGGELSQAYQGRLDDPHYRISLSTCLNSLPIEQGALVRRSGTNFLQTTRGGRPGRVISFDVQQANPYTLEFTDNVLRFYAGTTLVTTNDQQVVSSIGAGNPATVTTAGNHGWVSNNSVVFSGLGTNDALLQNRVFFIAVTGANTFTISDPITGAGINGATLGAFVSGNVSRVLELVTNYGANSWANIRSVQAETQAVLLNGTHPQVLSLGTATQSNPAGLFSITPSNFLDGPYLDPPNGSIVTYNLLVGNITLTFSFAAWSSTISYNIGDYVLQGGAGYKSIVNANLNNTPPNVSFWTPVQGGDPVGPAGFTAGDIGRLVRLFSEPPTWNSGTAYVTGNVVTFNTPHAYYQAVANSTGVTPGTDATKWAVVTGAAFAQWTWGRILSISGTGLIAPGTAIGNYTTLANAFDGTTNRTSASCATGSTTVATHPVYSTTTGYNSGDVVYYSGNFYSLNSTPGYVLYNGTLQSSSTTNQIWDAYNLGHYYRAVAGVSSTNNVGPPFNPTSGVWSDLGANNPSNTNVWTSTGAAPSASLDLYAGQDFHLSPKAIDHATIFPSSDLGFGTNINTLTFNLRAKHSVPANASDGTLLGSTGAISNTFGAVTITSNDNATLYEYFWVEFTATRTPPLPDGGSHTFTLSTDLAQVQFFAANVNNGSVVVLQLAGPALLYANTTPINTWRAGVYSDRVGWPTVGTYTKGRLWLGGSVGNRFDVSVANQIFNFAPTGPDGTVGAANAISYTLNAPEVNPILWMKPNAQGVFIGTQKREWLVTPASTASGIAPTNIDANPVTKIGCAFVEPVETEHTLVFVQNRQRNIVEGFPDVFSGKFSAPDLLEKALHLTSSGVLEIAYQRKLTATIWARCGNGTLIGATYRRKTLMTSQPPDFIAWHHHTLGSGRVVESITVGPSQGGTLDALTMVTNDPATGIRHVEMLTDYFEETSLAQNAWMLDDAVTPTSFTINNSTPAPFGGMTINGLWHLNGKTVQVFAGGIDCGQTEVIAGKLAFSDFTVSNGSVTVPFGDGISAGSGAGQFTAAFVNSFTPTIPIVVGFTYNSDGQTVRPNAPAETGARSGPAFGKLKRNHKYAVQLVNSAGMYIGGDFNHLDLVRPENDAQMVVPYGTPFSGVHKDTIDDAYNRDGQLCWRFTRPYPGMIAVVGGFVETQDE